VTDQVAPPRNREELVARLGDLRQQGVLDLSEEARLLQHYDELLRDVEEEKARLEPEYERRRNEDGLDAAKTWLAEAAKDLGRRHGEATRKITDQLQVVTG
jgi:DNA integrity scanning protein DisA with diadenylate cyclase activity